MIQESPLLLLETHVTMGIGSPLSSRAVFKSQRSQCPGRAHSLFCCFFWFWGPHWWCLGIVPVLIPPARFSSFSSMGLHPSPYTLQKVNPFLLEGRHGLLCQNRANIEPRMATLGFRSPFLPHFSSLTCLGYGVLGGYSLSVPHVVIYGGAQGIIQCRG